MDKERDLALESYKTSYKIRKSYKTRRGLFVFTLFALTFFIDNLSSFDHSSIYISPALKKLTKPARIIDI